ncbi:MAG TPA: hypothetical protein VEZ15_06455 [Acidimicrobiia bacterium]|nr:hypothetical protein [Acidimicrobiia bacterium]
MSLVPVSLPRGRSRREWVEGWPSLVTAFAVAGALALLAVCLGWRGSDLPAQVFRTELVRRDGFVIWNSQWFGGHAMLTYSVLAPAVASLTGPIALGALSGVFSAVLFERILRFAFGRTAWIGALWFALGTVTNLIVGRVTFALGVAVGLGAVYALQRRHIAPAVVLAVLCSLSSPLAGAFLAIAAAAWACAQRERRAISVGVAVAAVAPIATVALLFPTPGSEPYEPWALIWDLALCVTLAVAARRVPSLRWGAAFYAVAIVGAFAVPSALGGNVSRLGQYVAGPLLACALLPARRLLLAALAVPLLIWQFYPAVDGIAYAHTDLSTKQSYYAPLVTYLGTQHGPIGRVEIPSTYRHWEAAYAAPSLLLARGWERQLDIVYNPIFYSKPLNAETYQTWLTENGVAFVALPDARLDDSSLGERALLVRGLPYLRPVWHDAHWRVWSVTTFGGLAGGGAEMVRMSPDGFTLHMRHPGDVAVRVRATSHWDVHGGGCADRTNDGWTLLRGLPSGTVNVSQSLGGTPCPES